MKKVVIIGAGPAGLTAAYELLKKESDGYMITILEATNEIGGISKTVKYKGNRMDIGGHRFFSKNDEVMKLWEEIMPVQGKPSFDDIELERYKELKEGGPDPEIEDNVMLIRQRVSRIYYMNKFFDYPISMNIKTLKKMGLGTTIKACFSYLKAAIFKRKENSLEDFYINRFGKVLYGMFFEKYTEKLWGIHPSQISADWGAQRVKGISIKAIIKDMFNKKFNKKSSTNTETSLIEQFWYPKYGPGHLWEHMAEIVESKGAIIKKDCEVDKINFKDGKIVSVKCKNGAVFEGDVFISSMPLNDLINAFDNKEAANEISRDDNDAANEISHDDNGTANEISRDDNDAANEILHDDKDAVNEISHDGEDTFSEISKIANGLPFRDFLTVGVLVDKINLQNETDIKTLNNIIPDCWVYVQDPRVKMLRFQVFNNWSPYMVKDAHNTIWIGLEYTCKEGDEYWNMSDEEFIGFAIDELVKMEIIEKENVLDAHREKIKKAYPAYFDTYKEISKLTNYIDRIENLYCIGRNGQHRYNNMDHSMITAMEAARNIKSGVTTKKNIWNVNTEKQYHEEKSIEK